MGLQQRRATLFLFGQCIVLLPAALSLKAPELIPVGVDTWCSEDWCKWQRLQPDSSCGTVGPAPSKWKVDTYEQVFVQAAEHVAEVLSNKFADLQKCITDNTFYYPDIPARGAYQTLAIMTGCDSVNPSVWRVGTASGDENQAIALADLWALATGLHDNSGVWPQILYGYTCGRTPGVGWAPGARWVFTVSRTDTSGRIIHELDQASMPQVAIDPYMFVENYRQYAPDELVALYAANLFHEFLHNMGHAHPCSSCPEFVTVAGECMRHKGESDKVADLRRSRTSWWYATGGPDCTEAYNR